MIEVISKDDNLYYKAQEVFFDWLIDGFEGSENVEVGDFLIYDYRTLKLISFCKKTSFKFCYMRVKWVSIGLYLNSRSSHWSFKISFFKIRNSI